MVSASIVLYNTPADVLKEVVQSYAPSVERRLFLIDNSPKRNTSLESLCNPNVEYIFNGKNLGYGAAHNIGIKKGIELGAKYHVVLNPDIRFKPEVIDSLVSYADQHEDVVYMLPKVLYPDGRIQFLCKLLPTPMDLIGRRFLPQTRSVVKRNERFEMRRFGYDKMINPPCLSGCFMFLRVSTLQKNQAFFDESFFMYCEDLDLIRRLHRYGKTLFYPEVSIVHAHARESYKNKKMLLMHIKSAIHYFNKYGWFFDKERTLQNKKILSELHV